MYKGNNWNITEMVGKQGQQHIHTHIKMLRARGRKEKREKAHVRLSSHTETHRKKNRHMKPHIKGTMQRQRGFRWARVQGYTNTHTHLFILPTLTHTNRCTCASTQAQTYYTHTHTFDRADDLVQVFGVVTVWSTAWTDLQRVVRPVLCKKLTRKTTIFMTISWISGFQNNVSVLFVIHKRLCAAHLQSVVAAKQQSSLFPLFSFIKECSSVSGKFQPLFGLHETLQKQNGDEYLHGLRGSSKNVEMDSKQSAIKHVTGDGTQKEASLCQDRAGRFN